MVVLDEVIDKYFCKKNIRHAYLLETVDFEKILTIAKSVLYSFNTEVNNLNNLLDNGIYSDLKIIEPDGLWIKKEQIMDLKDEFKVKSAFNNKRIYIIKYAENLNKSSANTMLKFLEEPEENIIAILVTKNKNKVLETLVSRCQYILLDGNKDKNKNNEQISIDIFNFLEDKKRNAAIEIIKAMDEDVDRSKLKQIFNEIICIYEEMLLKKLEINVDIKYQDTFNERLNNNTVEDIKKKINGIAFIIDTLEYNVNLKLLMDKLVIMMFGVD